MNEHEQNRRRGIERSLNNRGRKVIDWWDGEPVHQPMTAYERFSFTQKASGVKVIDEKTFNLGLALLGHKDGMKIISAFQKP